MNNIVIAHVCSLDLISHTEVKNNKTYNYVEKCLKHLKWFDSKTFENGNDLYGTFEVVVGLTEEDCEKVIAIQLQKYLGAQGLDAMDFEFRYKYRVTKNNQFWFPLSVQSSWKKCSTYLGEKND